MVLVGIQALFFFRKGKVQKDNFNAKGYLILCCLELVVLAGVRGYTVGADTEIYLNAIDYCAEMSEFVLSKAGKVRPFNFEIGYFGLMKLCNLFGIGKTGFLFIVAIVIYLPVFYFIKRFSSNAYLSILCYFAFGFFSYSLGIFRQMIATSILLLGLRYVIERRFLNYVFVVVLASFFHTSAVCGIALYLMYGIKKEFLLRWIVPIEIALIVFGKTFSSMIVSIFPMYSGYISAERNVQGGTYLMLLLLNITFVACVFLKNKDESNIVDNITTCALFIAICVQCVAYSFGIMGRAVPYFSIYMIIAIPNIIFNLEKKLESRTYGLWKRETSVCLFALASVSLFVLTYISFNGNHYVVPYYMYFQNA